MLPVMRGTAVRQAEIAQPRAAIERFILMMFSQVPMRELQQVVKAAKTLTGVTQAVTTVGHCQGQFAMRTCAPVMGAVQRQSPIATVRRVVRKGVLKFIGARVILASQGMVSTVTAYAK